MWITSLLTLSALALRCLAAKATADSFQEIYAKTASQFPLDLDVRGFDKLVTASRNYSVAVLLTAMETRFGCTLCRDMQPEWDLLGQSWYKGDKAGASRVLFGTVDFANGQDIFKRV